MDIFIRYNREGKRILMINEDKLNKLDPGQQNKINDFARTFNISTDCFATE